MNNRAPSTSLWHRLDAWGHRLVPVMATLFLAMLGVIPLHIPGFSQVAPVLTLIAVYHWAVYEPELMPMVAVFGVGLFHDILCGASLGLNAFLFLLVHGIVLSQRRFLVGKSFAIVWLGFVVVAAGAMAACWIMVSLLEMSFFSPEAMFYQYLVTVGFFPGVSWAFQRWLQHVPGAH